MLEKNTRSTSWIAAAYVGLTVIISLFFSFLIGVLSAWYFKPPDLTDSIVVGFMLSLPFVLCIAPMISLMLIQRFSIIDKPTDCIKPSISFFTGLISIIILTAYFFTDIYGLFAPTIYGLVLFFIFISRTKNNFSKLAGAGTSLIEEKGPSEPGCLLAMGKAFVVFFIALIISYPLAKYNSTKKLEGQTEPPPSFRVLVLKDKEKESSPDNTYITFYREIKYLKDEHPDKYSKLTFDLNPMDGTIIGEDGSVDARFSITQEGGDRKVELTTSYDKLDGREDTYIYLVKGDTIHPISSYAWEHGVVLVMVVYALGLAVVFMMIFAVIKLLMESKKKNTLQSGTD